MSDSQRLSHNVCYFTYLILITVHSTDEDSSTSIDSLSDHDHFPGVVAWRALSGSFQLIQVLACTFVTHFIDQDPLATLGTGSTKTQNGIIYGNFLISTQMFSARAKKLGQVLGICNLVILLVATSRESTFLKLQLKSFKTKNWLHPSQILKIDPPILPIYYGIMWSLFVLCTVFPMIPKPAGTALDTNAIIHCTVASAYVAMIFALHVWYKRLMEELQINGRIQGHMFRVNLMWKSILFFALLNLVGLTSLNKIVRDRHVYFATVCEWILGSVYISSYFGKKFYHAILKGNKLPVISDNDSS